MPGQPRFCETNRSFFNGKSVNLARNTWAPTAFDNFEKSDYFIRPFLRFVGTILRNWIGKITGQPRFCVKRVLFWFSSTFLKKGKVV